MRQTIEFCMRLFTATILFKHDLESCMEGMHVHAVLLLGHYVEVLSDNCILAILVK